MGGINSMHKVEIGVVIGSAALIVTCPWQSLE